MWAAEREALLRVPPWERDRVTIYAVSPPDSAWDLVMGMLGVTALVSLVTVLAGWRLAGWLGALAGLAVGPVLFLLSAEFTVNELRIVPDGTLEARSPWRRARLAGASVQEVRSYLEVDEGTETWRLNVVHEQGTIRMPHFPEMDAFIRDLQALNPDLRIAGNWPSSVDRLGDGAEHGSY